MWSNAKFGPLIKGRTSRQPAKRKSSFLRKNSGGNNANPGSAAPKIGIGDIRREQLTQAAMKCIAAKGYDRVTLGDVAQEAGLSKGITSYYFKNREELLVSVIRRMWDDAIELTKTIYRLPEETEEGDKLYEQLKKHYANPELELTSLTKKGVKILLSLLNENPYVLKVILEFWCQIPHNPAIAELNNSMQKHLRNISAIVIAEGIKRGIFKKQDPKKAAYILISSIMGLAFSQILFEREFDDETLEKAISDLIFNYLQADK
ncbi:MAG: TetR family transcriptional regulator [Deltaproteobacteria bacterium]|nr:MAG: TetR family transcriptional regulator [Deltaproteobacteria bacterium]